MAEEHVAMEYSEITPNILVGTNMCCGMHAHKIGELGAKIDISLEYERTDIPDMFENFIWLPVKDHTAPSLEQLHIGTAVLMEADQYGYRVYVHCKNGHGRAPTLAIAYFIRKGLGFEEAFAAVRAKRPEISPNDDQQNRLKEFEKHYRSEQK